MFLTGPAALLLVLLPSTAVAAGILLTSSNFLMGFTAVTYNVNQVSFRQAITPLDIQGRMNATMRFIVWGTLPLGSFVGGILATLLPLRTTILIGAVVASSAFLWLLVSPVRSLREIPSSARSEVAAGD
jgi:MFS family permease